MRRFFGTAAAVLALSWISGSAAQAQTITMGNIPVFPNFGFNAATEKYEDLVLAGVIDPTKVTRTTLQNAASIASLMLTTEAMVCEAVEEVSS